MFPQAREEKLLVQEVGDELVVYDQKRHRAHRLNATAARIWRRCDGRTDVAELVSSLEEESGLPAKEDLVWLALDRLEKVDLLRAPVVQPEGAKEISRRRILEGLGVAGLAFLLPAVTSITAPIPAMAQYGGGGGGGGGGGQTCRSNSRAATFCCLCRALDPPAPTLACTRATTARPTTSSTGTCIVLGVPGGILGACVGQVCTKSVTWACLPDSTGAIFTWEPVGQTDSCPTP